jgi:hypothetical protein
MPATGPVSRLLLARRDPRVWRRTRALGLPVGLLQAALNQGDHGWRRDAGPAVVAKTLLSPRLACTIAFLSAATTRPADPAPDQSS